MAPYTAPKYTARDIASDLECILQSTMTDMRWGDYRIERTIARGGIFISDAVAQKLIDGIKEVIKERDAAQGTADDMYRRLQGAGQKSDKEMELWAVLLDRNQTLANELVKATATVVDLHNDLAHAKADLATYGHDVEETENRIIDAEFAQHDAETKLADMTANCDTLVANRMHLIVERDTAREANTIINRDRLEVCATLHRVEADLDAYIKESLHLRNKLDKVEAESVAWMKNYGMKTESLVRERDANADAAAIAVRDRLTVCDTLRKVEGDGVRLLAVARAAVKSIALDTTARWLTLNNACNDVKDILAADAGRHQHSVNTEPFLKPHDGYPNSKSETITGRCDNCGDIDELKRSIAFDLCPKCDKQLRADHAAKDITVKFRPQR